MERLLKIKEAAEFLAVNPETVRRLIRKGKLKAVKIGRLWRIRKEDIEALTDGVQNWTEWHTKVTEE